MKIIGRDFSKLKLSQIKRIIFFEFMALVARIIFKSSEFDPLYNVYNDFKTRANSNTDYEIIELGSRNSVQKNDFYGYKNYCGVDIHAGKNVDIIHDIHDISKVVGKNKFDFGLSYAVFEHLAMPWKVALEINRILKMGGEFYIFTHPAFATHCEPWDFWRFQKSGFHTLFNEKTGFKILQITEGFPAVIFPVGVDKNTKVAHRHVSNMGVSVHIQKTHDIDSQNFKWKLKIDDFMKSTYPV